MIVAVVIVAALAGVALILLSQPGTTPPPPPPPAGATLDHVTMAASATSLYPGGYAIVNATAVDTDGKAQTTNASFVWSATPAGSVALAAAGSNHTYLVSARTNAAVTVYANATWKGVTKTGSQSITINLLTFYVTSSSYHPLVPSTPTSGVTINVDVRTPANTTYTSYVGLVHVTASDPTAYLPNSGNLLFSGADLGVKNLVGVTINQSATVGGPVTITATDTLFPVITGSTHLYGNLAPTAHFGLSFNATDPRIISVSGANSTDPDAGQTATLSYSWAFGDGLTGSGITAQHTYAAAGTYTIGLTVSDIYGASNTTYQTYSAHSPPVASFNVKSQSANGPDVLLWADASASTGGDGTITTYTWTWGDGNSSAVGTPLAAHNYTSWFTGKTLTISLTVTSSYSLQGSTSLSVLITSVALPPTVSFSWTYVVGPVVNRVAYRTLTANATATSSPTGTALVSFNFTWGDGTYTNSSNDIASHVYATDGTYVINLTVVDANGLVGYNVSTAIIAIPPTAPLAAFTITATKLFVTVDANASWDPNNNIARYNWTWGDGPTSFTNTTNPWAMHSYSAAGIYSVTLTVIDTTNLKGTALRTASVAASTLDYSFFDFFNVSYGEWWDMRNSAYGDLPVNANCFNATSIADGICKVSNAALPTAESYPYTDWYPAPFGSLFYQQPGNDPFLYAPYRFRAVGVGVPGYNLSEPVFLPVLNYNAARGSLLTFSWDMQYLDHATAVALTNLGCPGSLAKSDDGFMIRSQLHLTMDYQEAQRIFGVAAGYTTPTQVRNWFAGAVNTACGTSGSLETAFSNALANEGNNKYDIWNTYQYPYTVLYTNFSQPIVDSNLNVHIYIDMSAWGTESLLARWFYWGNTSYATYYMDSSKARGWWGMELSWFEDFHFAGDLDTAAMNFTLQTVLQYHFQMGSATGPDGCLRNEAGCTEAVPTDDVPFWYWGPWLTDYVAKSNQHPYSELARWTGLTYIHSTPGGANYGLPGPYDYAPDSWAAKYGEAWHFVFPAVMRFYNPRTNPIPTNPVGQETYWPDASGASGVPYVLWKTNPANYGTYDNTFWTWDVAGNVSALPPTWPQQDGAGTYPSIAWGSIYFIPQGTTPQVAQMVLSAASAPALASGPAATSTPNPAWVPSFAAVLSPLLAWATTLIALPAPLGSALYRE